MDKAKYAVIAMNLHVLIGDLKTAVDKTYDFARHDIQHVDYLFEQVPQLRNLRVTVLSLKDKVMRILGELGND